MSDLPDEWKKHLLDPATVWTNMLRGTIAIPQQMTYLESESRRLSALNAELVKLLRQAFSDGFAAECQIPEEDLTTCFHNSPSGKKLAALLDEGEKHPPDCGCADCHRSRVNAEPFRG